MKNTLVVVPVRLGSSRLPNKPLADISGKPMVIRVVEQALKAKVGDVLVAAGDQEIVDVVGNYGYDAVLTDPDLPSGCDRVYAAVEEVGSTHEFIVNAQGDQPLLKPEALQALCFFLENNKDDFDIFTLATKCSFDEANIDSVAKVVLSQRMQALYFSRSLIPHGVGSYYQHIGIYGFKKEALKRYVSLSPSPLELRESLEQLRALEAGMKVGVTLVDKQPPEVNTPQDLELVRNLCGI